MLERFQNQLLQDFPEIASMNLFLAVSGGKDSMVLSFLLRQLGLEHTLLHCNFQLRGKEADEDEQFLLTYAQTYDLQIEIKRFDTYRISAENGLSIQETARMLRYDWFSTFAKNQNTLIFTAHHLDDSIETFFINLLRGTGIKGIKGIPKLNWPFYRPLLGFSCDDVFKFIDLNEIEYREDATNAETKYLRNRLRHSLIPLLLDIEPEFKSKMKAFFTEIGDISSVLDKIAEQIRLEISERQEFGNEWKLETLKSIDQILLQYALSDFGLKRANMSAFVNFLNSKKVGALFYSDSHCFSKDRNSIFVHPISQQPSEVNALIRDFPSSVNTDLGHMLIEVVDVSNLTFSDNPIQLDFDKVQLPILVRNWKHGDTLTPLGMRGKKLISDILIDKKIPQFNKHKTLVILDANDEIIGIPDLVINEYFKADQLTKNLLQITIKR